MRIHYDKKNDAMYIRFSESKYFESNEIKGGIIIDYDKKGKMIGLEILDVEENLPREAVSKVSFELLEKEKIKA